jgi:murein DD-endopeptidase MepM/ murein hydrolase activator NlpD
MCSSLVLVSVIFCCTWCFYSAWRTKADQRELAKLRQINQQYEEELLSIRQKADEAESYLQEVRILDQRVREMTGMDDRGDIASRSSSSSRTLSHRFSHSDQTNSDSSKPKPEEVVNQVTRVNTKAVQVCEELQILESDLQEYFAYLDALPDNRPISGKITSTFDMRKNPFGGRQTEFHNGVDFAAGYGDPIEAAGCGTVSFSGYLSGYGHTVTISHGYGYVSSYSHLSRALVKQGDKVTKGQKIALAGSSGRSTGPHLHFTIKKDGKEIDPLTVLK